MLPAGKGPRLGDPTSLVKSVRRRLQKWRAGEFMDLWEEAVATTQVPGPRRGRPRQEVEVDEEVRLRERNARKARTLAQEGQFSRATQALLSGGMADQSHANVQEMRDKHPAATGPVELPPDTEVPQVKLSHLQVQKAVERFRRGSAPGPSGMRPEHLKTILRSAPNRSDGALTALTRLVNSMADGGVPATIAPYMCGARLFGPLKKDGGIRPVAVGNLLRRLVAKCVASAIYEAAATYLAPHQLGVGVQGGSEAILHAVRQAVEVDPNIWVFQADYINVFNTASRSVGLAEVSRLFPQVLKWCTTCYSTPSILIFGDVIIMSESGFQQGDPIAAILFALVKQPVINIIEEEVPRLKAHAWFYDDGVAAGAREQLAAVVDILRREGPARGLHLSSTKSTVWCPRAAGEAGEEDPLGRGIPRVKEEGIRLLGAPVGSSRFVGEELAKVAARVDRITALLPDMADPHTEFVVLRNTLCLPKVMYSLRTVDTSNHPEFTNAIDKITRDAVSSILGSPLLAHQWDQANLPVGMGGLGVMAAADHGAVAYATSYLSSFPLISTLLRLDPQVTPAFPAALLATISAKMGEDATVESLYGQSQKAASLAINLRNLHLLSDFFNREGSTREVARLASLGLRYAGAWLNLVPCPALGLHLRPQEFIAAVKYRLGMSIFSREGPCPACGRHSDTLGDHALCCGAQGERIARHNSLRELLYHSAVSAALGPVREGQGLIPARAGARPADVLIPRWSGGQDAALDVTVTHPLQAAHVNGAAADPGYSLNTAYQRKVTGAAEDCRAAGITFIPIVFESLGGWHEVAVSQVARLGRCQARQEGDDEDVIVKRLVQKGSLLIQKGNAALWNNRVPDDPTNPHIFL